VGADGATHAGNYDIAFLRCVPNMVVATPSDENEARLLLTTCYQHPGPAAVRYPRGAGAGVAIEETLSTVPIGQAVVRQQGQRIALLVFGALLPAAAEVAQALGLTLVDMRFVKPIDETQILELAKTHEAFVTIEEASIMGGAGSAVNEVLQGNRVLLPVLQLGLPDTFIDHGDQNQLRAHVGLDAAGIKASIQARFADLLVASDAA